MTLGSECAVVKVMILDAYAADAVHFKNSRVQELSSKIVYRRIWSVSSGGLKIPCKSFVAHFFFFFDSGRCC